MKHEKDRDDVKPDRTVHDLSRWNSEMQMAILHAEGRGVVTPMPKKAHQRMEAIRTELTGLTHSPIHVTGVMVDDELTRDLAHAVRRHARRVSPSPTPSP